MGSAEEFQTAQVNRSIRTIKAELEYLRDASIITPQALNDLLSRIPAQTALHAPISVGALPSAVNAPTSPVHSPLPPTASLNNISLSDQRNGSANTNGHYNEKSEYYQPNAAAQPPPAYNAPPPAANWPPLAQATALYAYTSADAGDLELQPNDHVTVTEYMNAEWWKGRSTRTGQEGIFPRSYVKVIDEKGPPQANNTSNNYGNMPLEVSGQGNGEGKVPTKAEQQGKKFGEQFLINIHYCYTVLTYVQARNWVMLPSSALAPRLVATL